MTKAKKNAQSETNAANLSHRTPHPGSHGADTAEIFPLQFVHIQQYQDISSTEFTIQSRGTANHGTESQISFDQTR